MSLSRVVFDHKISRAFATCGALALFSTSGALAGDQSDHTMKHTKPMQNSTMLGKLHISSAWTRQSPPGAKVGGAYVTISNKGDKPDRLMGGSATFAKRVEIHSMEMVNNIMKMAPVEGGLEIKANETVFLKPGGFHIMLMGLKEPPKMGEKATITLNFENAGEVEISMPVAGIGAPSPFGDGTKGKDHSKMDH